MTAKEDCVFDVFYGTDYHSHLGTRRAGMVLYDQKKGFDRAIHNIESANFRPKFEKDVMNMEGQSGIGCISDYEPQPLIIRSHHGTYAITTVAKINNIDELVKRLFMSGFSHFMEQSGGEINQTELVAALIDQKEVVADRQESVDFLFSQIGIFVCSREFMKKCAHFCPGFDLNSTKTGNAFIVFVCQKINQLAQSKTECKLIVFHFKKHF